MVLVAGIARHTRVRSGIRLDERGQFWHDGEPVLHPAISRAWHRGLERAPDGRYLIRFGRDWAYVTVEDAPFFVRRVSPSVHGLQLSLSNETQELLVPETLTVSSEGVLYCLVSDGQRARFSRQGQADMAPFLRETDGGLGLELGNRVWPIGVDRGSPPPRPEDGPAPPDDAPGWTHGP
jgi:hypothetical protein